MAYILTTDYCADLPLALYKTWGVHAVSLSFSIEGKEYLDNGMDMDAKVFYDKVRNGSLPSTTLVNTERYMDFFRPFLESGEDVLYLAVSSGISGSCHCAQVAAQLLVEAYPERRVRVVDTLSASMGQGLLVQEAVRLRDDGFALEETAAYLEEKRFHTAHWFTVNDLHHLRRGGRVSGAAAFIGSILALKPVLHVDNAGRLIPMEKEKGRKRSLRALARHLAMDGEDCAAQTVMISHGDAPEDAAYLAQLVKEARPQANVVVHTVGPVLGAHAGPGVVALFFFAENCR